MEDFFYFRGNLLEIGQTTAGNTGFILTCKKNVMKTKTQKYDS